LRGKRGRQARESREQHQRQLEKLRDALGPIDETIGELSGKADELPWEIKDARLDARELGSEIKALNPRAQLAGAMGDWEAPPPDPPGDPDPPVPPDNPPPRDDAGAGAGGGPEPAPAAPATPPPPSAADIARAAAEQIAAFGEQQRAMFAQFGGNFVANGQLLGPGGLVSPFAALQAFGAFGRGAPGQEAGGVRFEQTIYMSEPPPEPHVWAQQQRYEIESALG
jgi:hypothetical protein